jgi:hypothetical protein
MNAVTRWSSRPGLIGVGFAVVAALLGLLWGADSAGASGCYR